MNRKTKVKMAHFKKFALYMLRWQCSTPLFAVILHFLKDMPYIESTLIANAIGACIFYPIDNLIFRYDIKHSKR